MSLSFVLKPKFLLTIICILFLFSRLYKIDQIPPSVYWDEASIGYNAYSVAQDGRDEWGKFLPIHFRAFGEFKLPVYIYSVVPFVKIFGLNAFSVRFPAILYSLGTILLTYLLAKKMSESKSVALWSSFLISISPWFFIFSRTGYEVTAGLMFYLLGIYLFFGLSGRRWNILYSSAAFILSAYSYNSFRLIIPLTILVLLFHEKDNLVLFFKKSFIPILISIVLIIGSVIPIYRLYRYDSGSVRLQAVSEKNSSVIFKNYLVHFDPGFLFVHGDSNPRSQQPGLGQLYLPEVVLLVSGLLFIIIRKSKYSWLPVLLLLLGPIPAALTKESPHALRSLSVVPFYAVISAYGVSYISKLLKWKYLSPALLVIFVILFVRYFNNFLSIYPVESQTSWQYPYKQFYLNNKSNFGKYDHILISDEAAQPYIFALFYLQFNPEDFREKVVRNSVDQWGFSTVAKFDKFEFGKLDQLTKEKGKSLVFDVNNNQTYEQENR